MPADPSRSPLDKIAPSRRTGGAPSPTLLAIGASAVLAAYAAGYVRTDDAAQQLAARSTPRRRASEMGAVMASASSGVTTDTTGSTAQPPVSATTVAATNTSPAARTLDVASRPTPVAVAVAVPVLASPSTAPPVAAPTPPALPEPTAPTLTAVVPPTATPSAATPSTPPTVAAPTTPATPPVTPASTPPATNNAKASKWKDGTFSGWGTSRHGDVEVTVIIEGGKISAAAISRCLTRYSCSWIAHLQPQVAQRQSAEVDNVSGATESANAFYYAVVEALKNAGS